MVYDMTLLFCMANLTPSGSSCTPLHVWRSGSRSDRSRSKAETAKAKSRRFTGRPGVR
jgi:hypothetical protein